MNVISQRGLRTLLKGKSDDIVAETTEWYKIARASRWLSLDDVHQQYPSADQVGRVLIFDIRHNRYRLITTVEYRLLKLYVKALLNHKQYDREEWKKWV